MLQVLICSYKYTIFRQAKAFCNEKMKREAGVFATGLQENALYLTPKKNKSIMKVKRMVAAAPLAMQVQTTTVIRKAIGCPLRRPCYLRRDSSCNIPVSNFSHLPQYGSAGTSRLIFR